MYVHHLYFPKSRSMLKYIAKYIRWPWNSGIQFLNCLLYKSICSRGESARRLADRTEYISLQQHAESQVWISGGERICLTGWLYSAFRPPILYLEAPTFVVVWTNILCDEDPHVILHVPLPNIFSLFNSGPHFHCRTGELRKSHQKWCAASVWNIQITTSFLCTTTLQL